MVFENSEKNFKLSESIISIVKSQNPKIEDVEDIMLELADSWGFEVPPSYQLRDTTNSNYQPFVDLTTQKNLDYFNINDIDDPEGDYKFVVEFIDDIRMDKHKNLVLYIDFQYANSVNGFRPLKLSEQQKAILDDVKERLKLIGCNSIYEWSPRLLDDGEGLWKVTVEVPIKFQPETVISSLDGLSKDFIKDFNQFVKDYSIDKGGQVKLSNLIRRVR